jgi:hypothetical protein
LIEAIKLLKDRRNPVYFFDLFKNRTLRDVDKILFSFTLDLERDTKGNFEVKQLNSILDFLKDYGKGTFFVETSLLKNKSFGLDKHEVGSHGFGHLALGDDWWISNKEKAGSRFENVKKSTELIKDILNVRPISFRCPKFSIGSGLKSVLFEQGYKVDSSENPHNPNFLPNEEKKILEIPVSRYFKPNLKFKRVVPYLKYDSLMFSNLKSRGVDRFFNLSKKIAQSWPENKVPLLNFMCHNWDFESRNDIKLVTQYFNKLEESFKVQFLSLKDYQGLVKNE